MTSRTVGYTRMLHDAPSVDDDIAALKSLGAGTVFVDAGGEHPRGRPNLKECVANLAAGDTLLVTSAARLSLSLNLLILTLHTLADGEICFRSMPSPRSISPRTRMRTAARISLRSMTCVARSSAIASAPACRPRQ
ncbi:recombinase family protein [Microbacterium sp. LRZ72]|uniref:recombinase family protein n=1 Tax=Microbacterium sp. LRZ72 TaxID=2942481 RepID=UPI0029AA1AC9|nr:recombinase family protein [Microbacterium sp. LRZ72]MDX2377760.1 recombinase family protein [Microbacterium sp. LRZ72]